MPKVIFVSKVAIAGGVLPLGLFGPNQVAAIGSIAGVLGRIASLGSDVDTLRQTGNNERYTGRQRTVKADPCFEGNTGRPTGGRAEALSQAILIYSSIR